MNALKKSCDANSKIVKVFFKKKKVEFKILSSKEIKALRNPAYEYLV